MSTPEPDGHAARNCASVNFPGELCDCTFDDPAWHAHVRLTTHPTELKAGHAYEVSTAPRELPKAPPAGLDPEKWATLPRRDRRVLLRHHRKVTGA